MTEETAWRDELLRERAMRETFMGRHPESPFISERTPFRPLRYFPPAPRFRIEGHLDRRAVPEEAYLRTNRDGQSVMRFLGDMHFEIDGRPFTLRVYHAGEGVGTSAFIPFRDRTSGRESYGPGRYLTVELNETDDYELDFNRAFNPYCAYTDAYECGLPPSENDLSIAIRAGEKAWALDQNPRTPNALILERTRRLARGRTPPRSSRPPPRARSPRSVTERRRGSR